MWCNYKFFFFVDVLVDDIELVESAYVPVKYPVPDKAGFDEVVNKVETSIRLKDVSEM